MSVFEDIESGIEISDEQAINYFHRILKGKPFRLVKRYKAYQFMEDLVQLIVSNNIPYTAEWCDSAYNLNSPQLYEMNDNNKIVLHKDVITYDNGTEIIYNGSTLVINIFRQIYSCVIIDYINTRKLSCTFTIQVEDMNSLMKSFLISDLYLDEIKKIATQYYSQIAYEKMIEMCVSFVKKDIEKLA